MINLEDIVQQLLQLPDNQRTFEAIRDLKFEFAQTNKRGDVLSNAQILRTYFQLISDGKVQRDKSFEKSLVKRAVRSQSGIVPIQVLTKHFWCPGKCIFCPNDFTMPKSYINTEPGAQRALLNGFDPVKQVYNRLLSLRLNGHDTDKIEMIVLGGTWDVYPVDYKSQFIKGLYDACNTFENFFQLYIDKKVPQDTRSILIDELPYKLPQTIEESIKINETTTNRMIGLTIETRPEYVTDENCHMWRERGITRIEMGIQSMFESVLDANKRGHNIQQVRDAMTKLRSYCFKISCHFMPGLYTSTPDLDIETFHLAFADIFVRPDEIKLYPTSVIPNTELYELYRSGEYIPLTNQQIKDIVKKVQIDFIPPYTRIKRLIRDIPATEVAAGSMVTNLRQLVDIEMEKEFAGDTPDIVKKRHDHYSKLYDKLICISSDQIASTSVQTQITDDAFITVTELSHIDLSIKRDFIALDTRSREVGHNAIEDKTPNTGLVVRKYLSSNGIEYFICIEDDLGHLYGFTRLSCPKTGTSAVIEGLGEGIAMIRELHVYGNLAKIDQESDDLVQHTGFGRKLLACAEAIARQSDYQQLSVISGVGVKEYYRKNGYADIGTYVVKTL